MAHDPATPIERAAAGEGLDDAVRAIGHPVAGRCCGSRAAGWAPATPAIGVKLVDAAGLSPSAASVHLKVLRDTGLMHVRVDAQRRLYSVDAERLAEVRAALDELWGERLDALQAAAERQGRRQRRPRSA